MLLLLGVEFAARWSAKMASYRWLADVRNLDCTSMQGVLAASFWCAHVATVCCVAPIT